MKLDLSKKLKTYDRQFRKNELFEREVANDYSSRSENLDIYPEKLFYLSSRQTELPQLDYLLAPVAFCTQDHIGLNKVLIHFLTLCFRRLPGLVGDGLGDLPERGVES